MKEEGFSVFYSKKSEEPVEIKSGEDFVELVKNSPAVAREFFIINFMQVVVEKTIEKISKAEKAQDFAQKIITDLWSEIDRFEPNDTSLSDWVSSKVDVKLSDQ